MPARLPVFFRSRPVPAARSVPDARPDRLRDAVRALRRIEQHSPLLRSIPYAGGYVRDEHVAVAPDRVAGIDLPVAVPAVTDPDPDLGRASADAVVLGRFQVGALRFRAWYVEHGLSLAVHAELPIGRRSRLLAGAMVRPPLRGVSSIVVPSPREWGRSRRDAWVVETLVPGRPIPPDDWAAAVPCAAGGLVEVWHGLPLRRVPANRLLPREPLTAFLDLVAGDLPGEDGLRLREAAMRLARSRRSVLLGLCHGDPVSGNWLRTADGQLVLVDWELARRRLLGHDAVRVLLGHRDALEIADQMAAQLGGDATGPDVLPWRDQLAIALVLWLAAWRTERAAAIARGRLDDHLVRVRHRLDLFCELTLPRD